VLATTLIGGVTIMKRVLEIGVMLVVVAALASPILAGHWQKGAGYGACGEKAEFSSLTEDQRAEIMALHDKYAEKMSPIKEQLGSKRQELDKLMASSDPDLDEARSLHQEISELQTTLNDLSFEFRLEARQVAPEIGSGWHHHYHHGYHHGGRPATSSGTGM
jgi:Spy/CpxP family protein refolding chaperone